MDAAYPLAVNQTTLASLSAYLRDSGSDLSLSDAANLAIRAWLAAESDRDFAAAGWTSSPQPLAPLPSTMPSTVSPAVPRTGPRTGPQPASQSAQGGASGYGYQWKELFLPDGTELRMSSDGDVHHARVTGDAIFYQGHRVSPRQLTLAIAGDGRNAWRDLSLRLPGEKQFRPALLLRRNVQAQIKADSQSEGGLEEGGAATGAGFVSPEDAIAAAAQAMAEALRTALALVELSCAQSAAPKYERRVDFHRRASDVIADHVKFD